MISYIVYRADHLSLEEIDEVSRLAVDGAGAPYQLSGKASHHYYSLCN
jgi:hypothetical protein